MAKSLNKLKGKKEWKWENEHQNTFNKFKEKVTSRPVLVCKFQVETDTSEHAIKRVLS